MGRKSAPQLTGPKARVEAFCQAFVANGFFAKRAALAAGYSERNAATAASEWLRTPEVQARIEKLKREKFEAMHMDRRELLARLGGMARSDIAYCYDDRGKLRPPHAIPEEIRRCITSYEGGDEPKVRLESRGTALQILAKHHRLLNDSLEVSGKLEVSGDRPNEIEVARRVAFLLNRAAKKQEA